jgi:hypothetical protein
MKLSKVLIIGAAATTLVGGAVLTVGASEWQGDAEKAEAAEVTTTTQQPGIDKTTATSNADVGVEQYWRGGRGWGYGRGWGGRYWGVGGRSWGRGYGYRYGRWGYWGPRYYGYNCDDGVYYCY